MVSENLLETFKAQERTVPMYLNKINCNAFVSSCMIMRSDCTMQSSCVQMAPHRMLLMAHI